MNKELYADEVQFKAAIRLKDTRLLINTIAGLADSGEVNSAEIFANLLLFGVWDVERIGFDMARGTLIPVPNDPGVMDPYLVLPRNVMRGVEYLRLVADQRINTPAVSEARNILRYLQEKGLAGFTAGKVTYYSNGDLPPWIKKKLDENTGNAAGPGLEGGFVQLPNVRPEVENPKTRHFAHMAKKLRDRCMYHSAGAASLVFLFFVSLFFKGTFDLKLYIKVALVLVALYFGPLGIFAYFCNKFGVQEKMPVCCCDKIREAHEKALSKLPAECRLGPSPFDSAPFYVRNLLHIKQFFYWLQVVLVLALFGSFMARIDAELILGENYLFFLIAGLMVPIISSVILMWDKKTPSCVEDMGDCSHFINFFLSVIYFMFDDKDCCREIEIMQEIEDFEIEMKMRLNK